MEKWIYELIVEKVPPFSYFNRESAVLLQLLIMLLAGILISSLTNLPAISAVMGALTILVVVLWSRLTLVIAPMIRTFRPSLSEKEREIVENYRMLLFGRYRPEFIIGTGFFIPLIYHLFTDMTLFQYYLKGNPYVIFFALILIWDVAYRAGIGFWVCIMNFVRSCRLLKASKKREAMDYTFLNDLKMMERIDRNSLFFGAAGFLLVPVIYPDTTLTLAVTLYSAFLITLSALSISVITKVPWLPPDMIGLLREAKFAYIGHIGKMYPHLTPVVQVFDGHNLFFVTARKSMKYRLLKKNPKVTVLIDERDERDFFRNRAIMIQGYARVYDSWSVLLSIPKLLRVFRLFRSKYGGYLKKYGERKEKLPDAWRLTPIVKRVPVEVIPENVIYWRGARRIKIRL